MEDEIQTWQVSEIDKKGKKKKGKLGIGGGTVFFASEADKVSLLSMATNLAHISLMLFRHRFRNGKLKI